MHAFRIATAIAYGFVLFYFVWVWVGGVMAARQVPSAFFTFFGQEPALALISFGLHFLPSVVLIVLGTVLFAVPFRRQALVVARYVLAGAVLSYVFWLAVFALQGPPEGVATLSKLFNQFRAPWWAWPALIAPAAAFLLTYAAAPRLLPRGTEA